MSHTATLGTAFPVTIKVLTPLHIGNGETLSPYADYVLDSNRNLRLINADALATALYDQKQIDHYIKDVIDTSTISKQAVLSQFIQHDLKADINAFMSKETLEGFGIENPILVDRCITTDGKAYLPGSSLKGAIRSALLHHWLRSGNTGSKNALEAFMMALKELNRRSDMSVGKKIGAVEKKFSELVEESFFGSIKQKERLPMSCLRVNDTGTCLITDRGAWQADRISLKTGESSQYNIKECVRPGTIFSTTISIDYYESRQYHAILEAINSKESLYEVLYQYTYDNLEHEWMLLGMMDERIQRHALTPYDDFVNKTKDEMENSPASVSYLRIGAGKMQLYQTIGNALYKHLGNDDEHPSWCLYLDYLAKFEEISRNVYPATRILTADSQLPFGWTILS